MRRLSRHERRGRRSRDRASGARAGDASLFHVPPFVRTRGRVSPGFVAAVPLFYPAGFAASFSAPARGGRTVAAAVAASAIGAALGAFPIAPLRFEARPCFRRVPARISNGPTA